MNAFSKVHVVVVYDSDTNGRPHHPVGYFSKEALAREYIADRSLYHVQSEMVLCVQDENGPRYFIGKEIDVDFRKAKREKELLKSAKAKLTPEEYDVLARDARDEI